MLAVSQEIAAAVNRAPRAVASQSIVATCKGREQHTRQSCETGADSVGPSGIEDKVYQVLAASFSGAYGVYLTDIRRRRPCKSIAPVA